MADDAASTKRIELVANSTPDTREAGRTGLGLLIGLFIGRNSLLGAATGSERFEVAIAHFVGVVLVSVAGVLLLGVLWDQARRSSDDDEPPSETEPASESVGATELPLGTS